MGASGTLQAIVNMPHYDNCKRHLREQAGESALSAHKGKEKKKDNCTYTLLLRMESKDKLIALYSMMSLLSTPRF